MISGTYQAGNHENVYSDGTGSMFEYDNSNDPDSKTGRYSKFGVQSGHKVSTGDAFAYALLAMAVTFIAIYAGRRYYKSTRQQVIDLSEKDIPLMT
jgi:hypothetical protein